MFPSVKFVFHVTIVILFVGGSHSVNIIELQNAFYQNTENENYQKWAQPEGNCVGRPASGADDPLAVNISLELYNYATVDETTSEYTFHFFFDLEWCDERLVFPTNATENGYYVEGSNDHIDRIWEPSIFVANNDNPGQMVSDKSSSNIVQIDANVGHVWLRRRKLLRMYCLMDFSLYPFDRQRCSIHFESNAHSVRTLQLGWGTGLIYRDASFQTIGFKMLATQLRTSVATNPRTGGNHSRCTFEFTSEREFTHYLMLTYLPSGMIVMVSWATFWLEITSPPARVALGVTNMLALVTSFKAAKSQLPTISYLNVLDIWNLACTVFIGLSLLEFAAVNYIYNTPKRQQKNAIIKQKAEEYRKLQRECEPLSMNNDTKDYLQTVLTEVLNDRQPKLDPKLTKYHPIDTSNLGHDSLVRLASFNSIRQKEKERSEIATLQVPSIGHGVSRHVNCYETNMNGKNSSEMKQNRNESTVTFSSLDSMNERPTSVLNRIARPPNQLNNNVANFPTTSNNSPSSILKRASVPYHNTVVGRQDSRESSSSSLTNQNTQRRRSLLITNCEVRAMIELTPEELANKIDNYCRYIFPFSFFIFNIWYWIYVFIRIKITFDEPIVD